MSSEQPLVITTTRIFPYPRESVFAAFTDPVKLATWWGPEGFRNTFDQFDFQPGGEWTFVMHGPDGTDYPNHSRFLEIVEPEKVVFQHLDKAHEFTMTMTYDDLGSSGTRMTWQMVNATAGNEMKDFIVQATEQNFDRLEICLKSMVAS